MVTLNLRLRAQFANWQTPASAGMFSQLAPSPSHVAGMLGAVLGHKYDKHCTDGIYSSRHLEWIQKAQPSVAIGYNDTIQRISWNVNGDKDDKGKVTKGETLRIVQVLAHNVDYYLSIHLANQGILNELIEAVKSPCYSVYAGSTNCPATLTLTNEQDAKTWVNRITGTPTGLKLYKINTNPGQRLFWDGYTYLTLGTQREYIPCL